MFLVLTTLVAASCSDQLPPDPDADGDGHTAPTEATIAANRAVLEALDFTDRQDFEDATKGLIASEPALRVTSASGRVSGTSRPTTSSRARRRPA